MYSAFIVLCIVYVYWHVIIQGIVGCKSPKTAKFMNSVGRLRSILCNKEEAAADTICYSSMFFHEETQRVSHAWQETRLCLTSVIEVSDLVLWYWLWLCYAVITVIMILQLSAFYRVYCHAPVSSQSCIKAHEAKYNISN